MPKILNYQLIEDELVVIQEAITHDKRPEVRYRAAALHMLHQGMKPQQVADCSQCQLEMPMVQGLNCRCAQPGFAVGLADVG